MKSTINTISRGFMEVFFETPYTLNIKVYETNSGYRLAVTEVNDETIVSDYDKKHSTKNY